MRAATPHNSGADQRLTVSRDGDVVVDLKDKTLLPGYSDDLAYDLGLIDTSLPRDRFREPHKINDLALLHAADALFSEQIRSRFGGSELR